ncbi:M48 family metalloprotease [Aquibacillus rhizosphaerae]|uniref:M48 family metalloprotease n=1 Tax=Aquibacillus rhizosphaerae TaxID=3051431 RepID=A0ABT7LA84_9BACI|nr:M48 family metalloprotease [Aquibacillus sp. LR5S19]MDL4842786.1 M48 family metalloprotease [Aquibacillus sp. LR5S19]
MKKSLSIYFIYLILVWVYFYFFYPLESYSQSNYAALAHAVFFSKLPLEWLLLYGLIKTQGSIVLVDKIEKLTKLESVKTIIFSFLLVVGYGLIRFPFNLVWFNITHWEGTSRQPFGDWLLEMSLDLFFYWIILSVAIYVSRLLMVRFKRFWWLVLWLLVLPIALFIIYIQPVWIDPLYEDFTEMEQGPLRTAIEEFTTSIGLEDTTLLQVNMSEKVTTFNAYVTGIMGNARIVMWDTTLAGMEQDEIMFILAHEIGHYVMHHVYLGVAGYLLLSLFLFFLTAFIYKRVWLNFRDKTSFKSPNDLRAVPILLLTISILLTIVQPISTYVSRQIEISADTYAIEHTEQLEPAIEGYQRMARQSKSDIDPVFWVKWMRSSHPSIKERIERLEKEIQKRETNDNTAS